MLTRKSLQLRPYQQEAVDKTIAQLMKSNEPCLIDASVSAGKTFINAGLMHWIEKSGRNALCLTMTRELVEQNSDCYAEFCGKPSVFCASMCKKNWKLSAVFASPQSLWAAIKKKHPISKKKFSLITIDEAHNINSSNDKTTYMKIINHYRNINPPMRIVGMTGTPFRGKGESILGDDNFFIHKTADISMSWLIDNNFVVPPVYGDHSQNSYDFSEVKLQSNGKFKSADMANASEGKRLTYDIVQEVVEISKKRKGVLIFASTIAHCKEVIDALPDGECCMITGETPPKERQRLIEKIKAGEIKYTVNLNVLTVGFSAPIIDHVVFLRPTESAVLWVQAIGRGVRQLEGKKDCLVSDYAGNLERLGDADSPIITDMLKSAQKEIDHDVPCPECSTLNSVFARRCVGRDALTGVRCGFFFDFKECPKCQVQNDTTARQCRGCNCELIDPNEKLKGKASFKIGVNPVTVPVINMQATRHRKIGKTDTLRLDYMIQMQNNEAEVISEWFSPDSTGYPQVIFKKEFITKHAPELESHSLDMILASKHKIKSPVSLMVNKKIGAKYLSIVFKEF